MTSHPSPAAMPTPASVHANTNPDDVARHQLAELKAAAVRFRDGHDEDPSDVVRAATAAASELESALDRSGS